DHGGVARHADRFPQRVGSMSARTYVAGLAVAALALTACSSAAAPATGSTTPVAGGTLRWGLQADPVCLDPRQGGLTASLTITRSVVDSLTDQDPDTGEIRPWLASSWETSADASSFTFHLRDDVT